MKKVIALSGLALMLTASMAFAQAGLNLALNDCGSFGQTNAPANCASNTGIALSLVGSATPPPGMDRVVACEGYIDVQTAAPTLSPWWTLDGCRAAGLTFSFDFLSGPFNCNDYWAGGASGGGGIAPEHTAPNRFQIKLVGATPGEAPLDPGMEHYMFKVNVTRTKSTGTGSCAGCTDAACLVLNRLVINQPAGVGDAVLTNPMHGNFVSYNGYAAGAGCPGATPSQNRTWGQVKSLYR